MCEAPICNCHHKMPKPKCLIPVLEVGKTYITDSGMKATIKFMSKAGYFIGEYENGSIGEWVIDGSARRVGDIWLRREYKEPEYWYINVYDRGPGVQVFDTRQQACSMANNCNNPKSRKGLIRINKETFKVEQLPI